MLCFCLPSPSYAGTYKSPVYTGGACTVTYPDSGMYIPYFARINPYGGAQVGYYGAGHVTYWAVDNSTHPPTPTSGSSDCKGEITATFKWQAAYPGDLPPKQVIVYQSCTAQWSGGEDHGALLLGICDNGLGDPQVSYDYPVGDSDSAGGNSSGGHYEIMHDPGETITLKCPAKAHVWGTGKVGSPVGNGYGNASVQYNADVWPLALEVAGLTKGDDGSDNILIGQGCSSGFTVFSSAHGDGPLPVTFQNFQWSVNGTKFASFDIAPDQSWGHVTFCDPAIWTSAHPSWFWSEKGDGTVSGTADVTLNGQWIGTVSETKPIQVWIPDSKMSAVPTVVTYDEPTQGTVCARASDFTAGITFQGSVGTPDRFLEWGTGQWCYAQLLWLNRVKHVFYRPDPLSLTTASALDGAFPYVTTGRQGFYPADSQADSPTHAEEDDSPNSGLNYVSDFNITDTFRMYMMYQPPDAGLGVQLVPIQSLRWHWNTNGSRSLGQQFAPDPPQGEVKLDGAFADSVFPHWDTLFGGHD